MIERVIELTVRDNDYEDFFTCMWVISRRN